MASNSIATTSLNWRANAQPLDAASAASAASQLMPQDITQADVLKLQPGSICYLPPKWNLPTSCKLIEQLAWNDRAYEHPVIIRAIDGMEAEIMLCSSFQQGTTPIESRPEWFRDAVLMWSRRGHSGPPPAGLNRGPMEVLRIANGGYTTVEQTWVRTDTTFRIDATDLKVYNGVRSLHLEQASYVRLDERVRLNTGRPARVAHNPLSVSPTRRIPRSMQSGVTPSSAPLRNMGGNWRKGPNRRITS